MEAESTTTPKGREPSGKGGRIERKVFISYSHDSPQHRKRVLEFSNRLRYAGIDADVDQYTEHKPPKSWPAWARHRIEEAAYVLVVCTQRYRAHFEGKGPEGEGQGSGWEGAIIELEMYEDELKKSDDEESRFVPVGFCARREAPIPRILSGTSYYNLSDTGDYQSLVRRLKGIATVTKPELERDETPGPPGARRPAAPSGTEERYRDFLREDLGTIRMLGSPDVPNLPVDTLDTFVHLDISTTWRCEERYDPAGREMPAEVRGDLSPDEVMCRAFDRGRVLLIIGDPGSGKTTLMKYYAMSCLSGNDYRKLGFEEAPLPVYFPLRALTLGRGGRPLSLVQNLTRWLHDQGFHVSQKQFRQWLHSRRTLLLLDGLDEIRALEDRRRACKWIGKIVKDPKLARTAMVVTSRWTGYRKSDQIELAFPHLRADVKDFSPEQRKQFVKNWFTAAFLREPRPATQPAARWKKAQRDKAQRHARQVIDYLALERNKAIAELAAVPLLLQIIAVIWKERGVRARNRADLYGALMRYLLEYRDAARGLDPLLSAEQALRVLTPTALWMQEKLQVDEVDKGRLHEKMRQKVESIDHHVSARRFFENLRDRAGIIADYSTTAYIFRHKSFREYLAGLEIAASTLRPARLRRLAGYLGDDWWEETLRFFISRAKSEQFDGFMKAVFQTLTPDDLNASRQALLAVLIEEACERKTDALVACLAERDREDGLIRKRCILNCLKAIDAPPAWQAIRTYSATGAAGADYARELLAQHPDERLRVEKPAEVVRGLRKSFRSPLELNAEYILIPSGSFKYSVSKKVEQVPDLYFAKYPVTNKRYRQFISYLAGKDGELARTLPLASFRPTLLEFADKDEGFTDYLGADPGRWAEKLTSRLDQEKRFKGDDQPVVGVSWYAAQAYCLWLSRLAGAGASAGEGTVTYRLPTEVEWEWAAAGRAPDGKLREYPWPAEKGEPNDKLANYGHNVGATTPVGRYPDGATPEGLMDMAGNVWEWMANLYGHKDAPEALSLRGGAWSSYRESLRCSARFLLHPADWSSIVGFRVVRSQS